MSAESEPQQSDFECAVVDCRTQGRGQACPYDGRYHYHGRIHYDCGYPTSSLTFRPGWWLVCDTHYAVLKAEREAWLAARIAADAKASK